MTVPPGHREVHWAGYRVVLHPAIHSRVSLLSEDGLDIPVYRQEEIHRAYDGHPETSVVAVHGGPHEQALTLTIHDPQHLMVSIRLEMRTEKFDPSSAREKGFSRVEVITIEDDARTCPPYCDPGALEE